MSHGYDDLDTEHLICRDTGIRHQWEPANAYRDKGGFAEVMECQRCGTTKTRWLTADGLPVKTSFEYAEGYVRKGQGRTTRAENAAIRMAGFRRRYKL